MAKNFAFLSIGVAIGFLLAKLVDKANEMANDPHRLADSIDQRLASLEGQLVP